jgi:hypothetical protein
MTDSIPDTNTEIAPPKQRDRPWPKGVSGNPAGKPRGRRNPATVAAESLLEGEAEALTRKAIDLALDGDAARQGRAAWHDRLAVARTRQVGRNLGKHYRRQIAHQSRQTLAGVWQF